MQLGVFDGVCVGVDEGDNVLGLAEGVLEGNLLGVDDGCDVGLAVGVNDGSFVGVIVGDIVL